MGKLQGAIVELLGTFVFVLVGAGSVVVDGYTGSGVGLLGIALAHGLALSIAVTATMNVSGGHINPAITVAMWATRRIGTFGAATYIAGQLIGAALAALLLNWAFPSAAAEASRLGATLLAADISAWRGVVIEAAFAFVLAFAVFNTAASPRAPKVGGFGVGLALLVSILVAGPLTGASLNPARTFGPALVAGAWSNHWLYWLGPVVGAVLAGVLSQRLLIPSKEDMK